MKKTFVLMPLVWILLFLTACAGPGLRPVKYDKPVNLQTTREVSVQLLTGIIEGGQVTTMVPIGGIFVPMGSGVHPKLRYNEDDQRVFTQSLIDELNRLQVVKAHPFEKATGLDLKLIFAQTQHAPSTHRYLLDVVMLVEAKGKKRFTARYAIDSEEGVSFFTKINTNASDGKMRASQMLMARMIPDIENYLSGADKSKKVSANQL